VEDAARLQREQPERFQRLRAQYAQAAGEGIETRGLDVQGVQRAYREHRQAMYRDIGGDQGPPGFAHELLTASVLGIGGYRRFGHLAPGQLAGGAVSALTSGVVTGGAFTAFYALQAGIANAVRSSLELQKSLVEVKDQASAIGQGAQFGQLRDSILSVSEATGVAGTDVASLAQEFLGLYQNATQAASATRDASEFVAESGVSASTAGPQLGALAQNFNITTRQAGNAVVTASQATGRRQGDILAAAADLAPVAAAQGFNVNQLFGVITAAGQGSALGGQQIGEGLARVLPEMQNALSKLARDGIQFSPQAMRGNIPQALAQLITQYNNPNVNRQQVLADLGGPKEAGVVASLANNPQAIAELNKDYIDNNALANRFAAVQQTVGESLARARASAVAFAESLIEGGLGQAFATIVNDIGGFIHVIGDVVGVFEGLNRAMGGIPGHLAEIAVALGLLNRIGAFEAIGGLIQKLQTLGQLTVAQAAGLGTPLTGAAGRTAERVGGIFAPPSVRRVGQGLTPRSKPQQNRLSRSPRRN
jgi:TP901 family phage tail tape measure protein